MKTTFLLLSFFLTSAALASTELQQQDFKTAAQCIASGASLANCLLLDSQVYVTAGGADEQLSSFLPTLAPLASPTFTGTVTIPALKLGGSSTANYCWTATDTSGDGSWQACSSGAVTSVGLAAPSWLTVTGSPVTSSGTITLSGTSETANYFLAAPNGSSGAMTPRAIVAADLPSTITSNTSGNAATATALGSSPSQCSGGEFATGIAADGNANCSTPSGDVSSVTATAPLSSTGGSTPVISLPSPLPVTNGGLATSTAPSNGQFPIGNSSGTYTPANLTAGSGISVTNGSGSATIAETYPLPAPSSSGNFAMSNGGVWTSATGPTVYTDNGASTYLSTNLIVSNNLATQINNSGQQARLEIGNNNLLVDPSLETSSLGAWSHGSGVSVITETSAFVDGGQAAQLSFSSVTAGETLFYQDVTPAKPLNTVNGLASLWVYSSQNGNLEVCPRSGGTTITTACTPLTLASTWSNLPANFIFPSSGSVGVALVAINNISSGTAYVDAGYLGLATNLAQTSQAQLFGSLVYAGTSSCQWTTTSTTYANFSATSACPTPTVSGNAQAPSSKIPGITFASMPPGDYYFVVNSEITAPANSDYSYWRFSDGTNVTPGTQLEGSGGFITIPTIASHLTYTTTQSNVTIQLQALTSNASYATGLYPNNTAPVGFEFLVYYFPTQSQLAYASNLPTQPQVTTYTSGSGTYTVPAGATRLEVKMVGGGGGGAGGGSSAGSSGSGGNTTFGTSLLTADGGAGSGGSGGSATIGSGASGLAVTGGVGSPGAGFVSVASTIDIAGGSGAPTPFGGQGGGGQAASAGGAAASNSGSGGGGGATGPTEGASIGAGAGGSAGGYVDAIITSNSSAWATSFGYAVGSGGAGATAGTDGQAGGNGAAGQIIVTAYFGNQPIQFVGQVSSVNAGQLHTEVVSGTCSSSSSITYQSGAWTIGNVSSGLCSLTIPSGEFSAAPVCVGNLNYAAISTSIFTASGTSSTAATVGCDASGSGCTSYNFNLQCTGPR